MSKKLYAWGIGLSMMLFALHNPRQPFLEYAFIPMIAIFVLFMLVFIWVVNRWRKLTLGDKKVWIPLAVISASITVSSAVNIVRGTEMLEHGFAAMLIGLMLFGLYVTARSFGREIFAPFTVAVIIVAASCVIYSIYKGDRSGGILSPTNYDIATGFLIFGTVVSAVRHQWWLVAVALVGLAFTGAEEALVAVALLSAVCLLRRDWSRKMVLPVAVVVIGLSVGFGTGLAKPYYQAAQLKVERAWMLVNGQSFDYTISWGYDEPPTYPRGYYTTEMNVNYWIEYEYEWEEALDNILFWRWSQYKHMVQNFDPIGHGYEINQFNFWFAHNVPMIIAQQVGIVAALAWIWVVVVCLIKTKWRYAFVAIIGMSLVDHYIWTQVAPWFWVLVGVATASELKSDLIFKEV